MHGRSGVGASVSYRHSRRLPAPAKGGERSVQTGRGQPSRMGREHMRRGLLSLFALAVLAASLAAPGLAAPRPGVTNMQLNSTFTVTGRTGSAPGKHTRAIGTVVVSGRWGSGDWHVLTTTTTDHAGYYRFTIKPHRRGNLTLRIAPPDHHLRRFLLHVY
jgi:hypothetical protein